MRRFYTLLLLCLFSVFIANSANTLLWHFDPLSIDLYIDPEVGDSIDCVYWIKKSLDAGGYEYDYHYGTVLPPDISSYDVIIGGLGLFMSC
jgi:hypothetical protein